MSEGEESEGEESEGEESEAEGNADANGQQEVGQVEGGGEAESISIEQAIELKLISADYLEAWWRSSRLW